MFVERFEINVSSTIQNILNKTFKATGESE